MKAIYYHDGDKIVLTGDPVAWDKGTRVSGKQITMFWQRIGVWWKEARMCGRPEGGAPRSSRRFGECGVDWLPGEQDRWCGFTRDGTGEKFSLAQGRERRLD